MLGLAGIASLVARPPESDDRSREAPRQSESRTGDASQPPSASAAPSEEHATIEMASGGGRENPKLQQGQPGALVVSVDTPGQVEIPKLGLLQSAEPLTPARFELLVQDAATYEVVLRPAEPGAPTKTVGSLRIVPGQ